MTRPIGALAACGTINLHLWNLIGILTLKAESISNINLKVEKNYDPMGINWITITPASNGQVGRVI